MVLGALGGGLSIGIIITAVDNYSRQLTQAQGKVKAFSISLKTMGKIAAVAFAALTVAAGIALFKSASSLAEIKNKFEVTFAGVSKEAEAMAKDLQDNYGLAERTSKELLGTTGDLLTGFGFAGAEALELSGTVNKLAMDLASFANVPIEQASMAVTKGLLGERESMKLLGIAVNENTKEFQDLRDMYVDVEGKTLVQAKALATLDIALSQSKNALGDAIETQDSLSNRMKRAEQTMIDFKDTLAEKLSPAFLDLAEMVKENQGAILDLAKAIGTVLVLTIKGFVWILKVVQQAGVNFAEKLYTVGAAIQWLVDLIEYGWDGAAERLELRLHGIKSAAEAETEAIWGNKEALEEDKKSTDKASEAKKQLGSASSGVVPSINSETQALNEQTKATERLTAAQYQMGLYKKGGGGISNREAKSLNKYGVSDMTGISVQKDGNTYTGTSKGVVERTNQAGFDGMLTQDTNFKAHAGENVSIQPAGGGGNTNVTINVSGAGDPAEVAREIYKKFAALGG